MSVRVQVILEEEEKERLQAAARRHGVSLSAWLRSAALEHLKSAEAGEGPATIEQLRAFFRACDEREQGREPDWEEHEAVIARSIASGTSGT